MWVNPDDGNADGTLLSQFGDGEFDVSVWIELVNGKPVFSFGDGKTEMLTVSSSVSFPKKNWGHLTCTRDGSTASIYIDGVLVASESYDFEPVELNVQIFISDGEYEGKIDEFRIYEGSLSDEEIGLLATTP